MSSISVSSLVLGSLTVQVDGADASLALSVLSTAPASLAIELGTPGAQGDAATIAVGTTTTLSPGVSATVANVGTSSAAVFNFGIPAGQTGATGSQGPAGTAATITAGSVTTLSPGAAATVTNVGTTSAAVFDFGIPQGQTGATGATGATGPAGPGVAANGTTGQALVKASNTSYDTAWATFVPGDRYLTASTTSLALTNGTKTLTIGTGLSFSPTQDVTISYTTNPNSYHMHGTVTSYDSGTGVMVVDVQNHTGSGTFASWTVNVGGLAPLTTVAWGDIVGTLSNQTDLQSALDAKLNVTTAASTYYPLTGNPSGFLTSAPVTSVAGRTGAITLAVADVSGAAPLASPSLTGVPLTTTAAADTNTTQIASTAFVVGQAASVAPSNDAAAAAVGTSLRYARADHVHLNPLPTGGTVNQVLQKNSSSNYDVSWVTPSGGGGGSVTVTQYTTPGTYSYTIPTGATQLMIYLWGSGGGGGSGARLATTSGRGGGAGGTGGSFLFTTMRASAFTSPVTVVVPSGGAGASAIGADNTMGGVGTNGSDARFDNLLALQGLAGSGGIASNQTGPTQRTGAWGAVAMSGTNGGSGNVTSGGQPTVQAPPVHVFPTGGGGGAGNVANTTTSTSGGAGGIKGATLGFNASGWSVQISGGAGGVNPTTPPTSGVSGLSQFKGGTGGGGGGYATARAGQAGANGSFPGGGGGGGSASDNGFASGAGGNGADGMVLIIAW